jgi:hypothetical protein
MRAILKTAGDRAHTVLAIALLAACAANLMLLYARL